MKNWLSIISLCGLFALSSVVYLGRANDNSLQALDSTTHALIASSAVGEHFELKLPLQSLQNEKRQNPVFNDHPFGLFYLSGVWMKLFGESAWSARFVPGLFSVGCVVLLALLGHALYSPAVGLVSGLILLATRDFVLIGSRFHLDTAMVFFILLSFYLWVKNKPTYAGVAAGLGMWVKTPVCFLLYPSVLLLIMCFRERRVSELKIWLRSALVALIMGLSVWGITAFFGGVDLARDYFMRQVWGTAVQGRSTGVAPDYGMLWLILKRNYQPWVLFLGGAIFLHLYQRTYRKKEVLLPLAAAVIVGLTINFMKFKFYWYFLPIYPFLALVIASAFRKWLDRWTEKIQIGTVMLGLFGPTLIATAPIELGPENFPALRKFASFIQSEGGCSDRVFFIEGGQPFGSELDSLYMLTFYTKRKVDTYTCEEARLIVPSTLPDWIIVTGANLENCLSKETRQVYLAQYRYGSQYLLGRNQKTQSPVLDLTPLERELVVPKTCEVGALPRNSYFPGP